MFAIRDMTVSVVNRVPGPMAAPFRSGGLLARTAAPMLERLLPIDPTEIVVRSGPAAGLRLRIDTQREKYYWTGTHERAVQDVFRAVLRPGDVVWDVGAHIGFFSLLASRLVGPSGAVVAFEPVGENRSRLETNLSLNGSQNVSVRAEAVGSSNGVGWLQSRGSSLMWTLHRGEASQTGPVVACVTLDDVARELRQPTLIKIDVEGTELEVLRAAVDFLARRRPYVALELHRAAGVDELRELLPFYECDRVDRNHWLLRPR
jgi:FkbM family methyltransferase